MASRLNLQETFVSLIERLQEARSIDQVHARVRDSELRGNGHLYGFWCRPRFAPVLQIVEAKIVLSAERRPDKRLMRRVKRNAIVLVESQTVLVVIRCRQG